MKQEILRMNHIVYRLDKAQVLNHFTMQIFEGEIYGILNMDQVGMDSVIDLICSNKELEFGQIFYKDKLINRAGKSAGSPNKVGLIETRPHLIDTMTLTDNLFVIRPGVRPFILSDKKLMDQTKRLLNETGVLMDPGKKVGKMSTLERYISEILKSVVRGNTLIILNDISDQLGSEELPKFHAFIRNLADKGFTFLYIYRHHEVLRQICDRMGILKNKSMQKVYWNMQDIKQDLKNDARIFARSLYDNVFELNLKRKDKTQNKAPILQWENVSHHHLSHVSLTLYSGEITILLDRSNTVLSEIIEKMKEQKECRAGIIDENPVESMLFPELSYLDNLCFMLGEKIPFFWQQGRLKRSVRLEYQKEIGREIDAPNLYHSDAEALYTLIYYRYLIAKPDLIVCLKPLSGLDIHLRSWVLALISRCSEKGIAVLILATELYDTLYIADRLIQMKDGKIIGDTQREEFEKMREEKAEIFPD